MSIIDISDINLYDLIRALVSNALTHLSKYSKMDSISIERVLPTNSHINEMLNSNHQIIDYFLGVPIKINFNDLTKVNTSFYNRYGRPGSFEKILASLRI
jgi:hypothetical protein